MIGARKKISISHKIISKSKYKWPTMVIACSNELSLIDNKEKVRVKRKGIPQDVKTIWMTGRRFIKSISKVSSRQCVYLQLSWRCRGTSRRSKITISLNFLFRKILSKNVLGKNNCLHKGFRKTFSLPSALKIYLGQ